MTVKYPFALIATFLWIGFIAAISFMEAWLKFRAPGVTIPIGLGIGRLVFAALNKVELILSIGILVSIYYKGFANFYWTQLYLWIPFILVVIQTIWLLPALDARAELHIQAQNIPPSNLHFYYVGMELVKIFCLLIFGLKLLNYKK